MLTHMNKIFAGAALVAFSVGCGGPPKPAPITGDPNRTVESAPPPPEGTDTSKDRKVSYEAEKDFAAAVKFYQAQAKKGWTGGTCDAAAERFLDVASNHKKLAEAVFNAGVAHENCKQYGEAEKLYKRALKVNPAHAGALANLGRIYYQVRNNADVARQYWERSLKASQKTSAAHNNLAWLKILEMRKLGNAKANRKAWKALEKKARGHLSAALAVENDNVEAYVLYSLLFQEGWKRNKSRLDMAKLLLGEGAKHKADYAPLHNARGLLQLKKNNVSQALNSFGAAVAIDPSLVQARMNVGNIVLGFRKYDEAKVQFDAVLKLQPKNYDAIIGLGIAERGLRNLDGAEAAYDRAKKLSPTRSEAYFNLGVLYYSFRANEGGDDFSKSIAAYEKSKDYFKQFLAKTGRLRANTKVAKETIEDVQKIVKQLKDVKKAMDAAKKAEAAAGAGGSGAGAPQP